MKFNFLNKILPRTRISHPVSFLLRPVFESRKVRSAIGGVLALGAFSLGINLYSPQKPVKAFDDYLELQIITKKITIIPIPDTLGISQGYGAFHGGIDFRAPRGSFVYSMRKGKVIKIIESKYGYGRHIIIDHGNELKTVYAHLGKILVEEGEEVDQATKIAEVGLSGRTTGYHLHFEVRKKGKTVNPWLYLSR